MSILASYNQTEIDFLKSLNDWELEKILLEFSPADRMKILQSLLNPQPTERDQDLRRQREKRSEAARIEIPAVVDWNRRDRCLDDPELFLKTYFKKKYTIPFGPHHYRMIDTIISRAKYGGRQAVAAPRGRGKTELAKGLLAYLILKGLVRCPLAGGATTKLGKRIYTDVQHKLAKNDLLLADFPEVCFPIRALEGAPQRAAKQHINGQLTNIVWTSSDYFRLPDVEGSPFGGVKMAYFGLDSAFRGFNIDGDRVDYVLLDDPETRESAKSYEQGVDREEILDRDIAGLGSQEDSMAITVLTTTQNCYCLSYRLTDPKIKPSWNGVRFGMVIAWPDDMDKWHEYISIRHKDQSEGDEHGLTAVKFYIDNRVAMDAGCEMLTDHFVPTELEDGTHLIYSAIQQAFNKIADTSMESYLTEYQNDPTPDDTEKQTELTAATVANRISGLERNILPEPVCKIGLGIDIGDHYGHWVKIASYGNAIGNVIDYGIMEVTGYVKGMSSSGKELAIYRALVDLHKDIMVENPSDFALVDSGDGDHTTAVYKAVREFGEGWAASKGYDVGRFHMPTITLANKRTKRAFDHCWAGLQPENRVWLYNVDTEHWKHWLQLRFQTTPWNDEGLRNDGSFALFESQDVRQHQTFSHHVVAECRQERFVDGKGWVRKWIVKNRNNHYLDAAALACCALGCLGVKLLQEVPLQQPPTKPKQVNPPPPSRYRQRPGGWVPKKGTTWKRR